MPTISGLLFDVGGVLVSLDGMPSLARLMGIQSSRATIHQLWMACPSVIAHETGKIGRREFANRVVGDMNLQMPPELFLQEFCTWPEALLPGALQLIRDIPKRYKVGVLSNTSAAHWERITAFGLGQCFDRLFLSHEIGCLKPSNDAFRIALEGMALGPEEVMFFDDNQPNIDAANAIGMVAHLVRNPGEVRAVLDQAGVLSA